MSKNIVLVDDDQGTLVLTKSILSNEGYAVEVFTGPTEAFEYIKNNPVDLLIIDIMMPSMNGVEAVKSLISESPDPNFHIIFLTGIFNKEQKDAPGVVIDGQSYPILPKPVEPQRLMSVVKQIFAS